MSKIISRVLRRTFFPAVMVGVLLSVQLFPLIGQDGTDRTPPFHQDLLRLTTNTDFPDAEALVLSDVGTFNTVDGGTRLLGQTHRKIRIQILSETEIDRGNIELFFYHENGAENITRIKGKTYNLEDGKLVTSILKKKQIFREKIDEEYSRIKFSLPNVKVGSILEYEYTRVVESLFSLTPWYFQTDIPTIMSDYKVYLPPNSDYTYVVLGTSADKFKAVGENNWRMKNLPGIKEEAYTSSILNYLAQMRLQLRGYNRGNEYKRVLDDWPSFTQKLLNNSQLGERLGQKLTVDPGFWEEASAISDPMKKMVSIYNHVKDRMKWDGEYTYFCSRRTEKAYVESGGNSAEINMILIQVLREAGITADPLLISTRGRLKPFKDYPLVSAFNHLLAYVVVDGSSYILDATDPLRPYNLLAFDDLHHKGWLLKKDKPRWVEIPTRFPALKSIGGMGFFDEEGFKADFKGTAQGFYGLDVRKELSQSGEKAFAESLSTVMVKDEEGKLFQLNNPENLEEPVSWNYQVRDNEYVINNHDLIYINPMFGFGMEENPFQAKERFYPVDFGHSFQENYSFTLQIPDGYEVESLPESQRYVLPKNVASFEYIVGEDNGRIQMRASISVRESYFIPEAYFYLRELFDRMINKQSEQWVLRRKS